MIDIYINSLAKIQICTVIHSRVIRKRVSPKNIQLCMERPCWYPLEGQQHGGLKVTETSVIEFAVTLERNIEINTSSRARTI